jgi:tetratricopeptide (TPR) repeat protein
VSPANRVRIVAGLGAVAAAAIVVGVVSATRQDPPRLKQRCDQGAAPLLAPGVPTAHAAAVKAAFAERGTRAARSLEPLAQAAPRDAVVQFNYAIALYCAGYVDEAAQAFRTAKSAGRDTIYEMRADAILHPQYFAPQDGLYPLFQQTRPNELLARGVVLQRQGHQHSAERLYERAAKEHPDDDEAQVAAAVGRFDEDNLAASFSRLGPLVRRFPDSASVRFHLGLLLAWTGQRAQAVKEFRAASRLGAKTDLGREANAFLRRLGR